MANMSHRYEPDQSVRSRRKYYNKLRQLAGDLDISLSPDLKAEAKPDLDDKELYGVITKSEIELILSVYERQEANQGSDGVKCDQVRGGSFSKLLFSKPGFHNPGSSQLLLERLKIKHRDRNSFLGGHSTFLPTPGNHIEDILTIQKGYYIRDKAKQIYSMIEERRDENHITDLIQDIIKIDGKNSDALAVRGKWSLRCKNYDQAVKDLDAALQTGCWDDSIIRKDLSMAYSNIGEVLYAKGQFIEAADQFYKALIYNDQNEVANLNIGMCQNKISQQRFGSNNAFSSRRK